MPSIQNTIIELNFTLLSGRIYKNKAKSAGNHHVRYSFFSPLLVDNIILHFLVQVPIHYTHPIWLAGKHKQVTVSRYAKV